MLIVQSAVPTGTGPGAFGMPSSGDTTYTTNQGGALCATGEPMFRNDSWSESQSPAALRTLKHTRLNRRPDQAAKLKLAEIARNCGSEVRIGKGA